MPMASGGGRSTWLAVICALAMGTLLGAAAAWIAEVSTGIATVLCAFGGIGIGIGTAAVSRHCRRSSRGQARGLAFASTAVMLSLFYGGILGLAPADQALFESGKQAGKVVFGLVSVVILFMADHVVRSKLSDPFCEACGFWARTVPLFSACAPWDDLPQRSSFDWWGDREGVACELFESYLRTTAGPMAHPLSSRRTSEPAASAPEAAALDFEYLGKMRRAGSIYYNFELCSCSCRAIQLMTVTRTASEGPTSAPLVRLRLTTEQLERIEVLRERLDPAVQPRRNPATG